MKKWITLTLFLLCNLLYSQRSGKATFYHDKYENRTTASGDRFKQAKLTAASNIYKMGSILKVTNKDNDKSVIVRVNDTGAFRMPTIVDLSKSAFKSIGDLRRGWLNVIVEVIE